MSEVDPVLDAIREIRALNFAYGRAEITLDEWNAMVEPLIERAEQAQQECARSAEGPERSDPQSS